MKTVCCAVDERHVKDVKRWIRVDIRAFVMEHTTGPYNFLKRSHTMLNKKTLRQVGIH